MHLNPLLPLVPQADNRSFRKENRRLGVRLGLV